MGTSAVSSVRSRDWHSAHPCDTFQVPHVSPSTLPEWLLIASWTCADISLVNWRLQGARQDVETCSSPEPAASSLPDVEMGVIAGQSPIAFVRTTGWRRFICCCRNASSGGRARRGTAADTARPIRGGRGRGSGSRADPAALVRSLPCASLRWRFGGGRPSSPAAEAAEL